MGEAVRVKMSENTLELFSRDKLFISLYESLSHRKTALKDAGELSGTITTRLIPLIEAGILSTAVIFGCTQEVLERFDSAAAVYYRAHHR